MISFEEFVKTLEFPPTPEQRAVIESNERATLVIAGAGSGKTATMAQRIAWKLVSGEVRPEEVLGLTFTRKAAGELAERVNRQIRRALFTGVYRVPQAKGDPLAHDSADESASAIHALTQRPTISTYNSFAADIATSYAMLIGEDPRARLMTEAERWQIMFDIVNNWPMTEPDIGDGSVSSTTQQALTLAASLIDNAVSLEDARVFLEKEAEALSLIREGRAKQKTSVIDESEFETFDLGGDLMKSGALASLEHRIKLLAVVERYFAVKKERSLIEFADQVSIAARVLEEVPDLREQLAGQYKLVLLDEYQDTSVAQAKFINAAFGDVASVTAVGDPNQAIYGWRGASANALSDFEHQFLVRREGQLSLSTAFRNSTSILDAANALTRDKLTYPNLKVRELVAPDGRGPGNAEHIHTRLAEDGYAAMAERFKQAFTDARVQFSEQVARGEVKAGETFSYPSAAVLIRANSYREAIIKALEAEGLPYDVVGGEAIILKPEVVTVRALLTIASDPRRNDRLAHLLNFFGIGAADIVAFAEAASDYARVHASEFAEGIGIDPKASGSEVNLAEALEAIRLGELSVATMSDEGRKRLVDLSRIVHLVRARLSEPLPDLISYAINSLDLRMYAAAKRNGGGKVRAAFGSFIRLAAQFAQDNPGSTLPAFLGWLDEVEVRDRGGEGDSDAAESATMFETEDIEPEAGVVQILTVHAAKGLEWDLVAIPEMVPCRFDEEKRGYEQWATSTSLLPHPLRADCHHLPQFTVSSLLGLSENQAERKTLAILEYGKYVRKVREHAANEERRLAYVGVTRPRELLLVMTYDAVDAERANAARKALEEGKKATGWVSPGAFVVDMSDALTQSARYVQPIKDDEEFITWAKENVEVDEGDKTRSLSVDNDETLWPRDVDRSLDRNVLDVPAGQLSAEDIKRKVHEWDLAIEQILQRRRKDELDDGLVRDYLTASDIVYLSKNAAAFYADQRRPIPSRPSIAARRGTRVHAAIAHHFDSPATLDIDSVADGDEMPLDVGVIESTDAERVLINRFETSRFAHLPHLAIERAMEVSLAGYPVRCVVDAVLDTSSIEGSRPVTIVDWKTGRRPNDEDVLSRQLQLGIYRIVWSRVHGVPLDDIDACFYFLGEPDESLRELQAGELGEDEIEQLILSQLRKGEESLGNLSSEATNEVR